MRLQGWLIAMNEGGGCRGGLREGGLREIPPPGKMEGPGGGRVILQRYGQRLIKITDKTLDVGERVCSTPTTCNCFGLLPCRVVVNVTHRNLEKRTSTFLSVFSINLWYSTTSVFYGNTNKALVSILSMKRVIGNNPDKYLSWDAHLVYWSVNI